VVRVKRGGRGKTGGDEGGTLLRGRGDVGGKGTEVGGPVWWRVPHSGGKDGEGPRD
jgi:hypothetical protein